MADSSVEYITKDEFDRRINQGELYNGFVIGFGYAFYSVEASLTPAGGDGEVLIGYTQSLDESPEMKKRSISPQDNKYSLPTVAAIALGGESIYSDIFHNHETYITTKGKIRPIYKTAPKTGKQLGVLSDRAGKFARLSKGLQIVSFAGGAVSTGLSGYNVYDSWSKGESINTVDAINTGVGTIAVVGTFVESLMKKGVVKSGVLKFCVSKSNIVTSLYSWTSMWFELGAEFGPSKWYGDDDMKWFK